MIKTGHALTCKYCLSSTIVACIANNRTDRCKEGFSTIFFQSAMDTSRLQGLNTSSISQQETCYDFAVDFMYSQKINRNLF